MRYIILSAGACASVAGLAWAAPVSPVLKGDLVMGLARGTAIEATEHARNGVNVGSQWNAPFVQSMVFDNLDGFRHNPKGNLLGMSFGATATGATIWNLETRGTGADPGNATEVFDFLTYNSNNPGAELGISRGGGISVSPDNTRIAFAGNDVPVGSPPGTTPGAYVLNYAAGDGNGGSIAMTGGRQLLDLGRSGSTQGTTWLNNNSFLLLNGNGVLHRVDDNGTTLTSTTVGTITLPGTGGNPVTSLAYEPTISPFVYALVGQFTGAAGTPPNTTLNRLYVLDPDNNYSVVTTADYNTAFQTTRELDFGPDGALYVTQFGTATGMINSAIGRIENAWNVGSLANDAAQTTYYSAAFAVNFSGHDVTMAHPDYVRTVNVNFRDNATAVEYFGASPINDIRAKLQSGFAGGSWTGPGISSSVAAATPGTGIGYKEVAAGEVVNDTFAGGSTTVGRSSIYMAYTLLGDANVDRSVDIGDFAFLASNFNSPSSVWGTGDFNYDGVTNISDFALLAANFNQSLPGDLPRGAVPEPSVLGVLGLAGLALRRRR